MQHIAVVGAGAMGCYFAARIAEAGRRVTVIDVDVARLAAIAKSGIEVDDDRGRRAVPVGAALAADVAGSVDVLIVFTKGMHTAAAIESCRHLLGDGTLALTLQNGLGNDDIIAGIVPPERIVIGMTDVPADLTGPSSVSSHGKSTVVIGDYEPAGKGNAGRLGGLLEIAQFNVTVDEQVRVQIWEKVAFNAAMNSISAITGCTVGEMDTPEARELIDAVTREVVDTAHLLGISADPVRVIDKTRFALAHHQGHKPSMLQDIEAGRKTEIESINAAVVRAAVGVGAKAPANATLTSLVRVLEGRKGKQRLSVQ